MNTKERVRKALFSNRESVELSSQKVELKLDFSVIQKRVSGRLKDINKIHNDFLKVIPKLQEVKKGYEQMKGVPNFEQKELEKYYKQYDKLASELGIKTQNTEFYKEFLEAKDQVRQMDDIIQDIKSRL